MSEAKKKWLGEVDIMRAFGIIAVLVIHATGSAESFPKTSIVYSALMRINHFFLFAVPLFLFVSALVLTFKYSKQEQTDWLKFYKSRMNQVIVPYIIWTFLYFLYRFYVYHENFKVFYTPGYLDDIKFVVSTFVCGRGYFHLYFISIIIQFYIVFPFIINICRRFSWLYSKIMHDSEKDISLLRNTMEFIFLFSMLFALQFIFNLFYRYYISHYFRSSGVLLPSYILPIGAGVWLGWNYDRWNRYQKVARFICYPATILFGCLFVNLSVNDLFFGQFYSKLTGVSGDIYVTFSCMVIYDIAVLAKEHWSSKVKKIFANLGLCSFGIYLIHLMILKTLHRFGFLNLAGNNNYLYCFLILASFIITLVVSWVMVRCINRSLLAPILFGNRKTVKKVEKDEKGVSCAGTNIEG